MNLTHLNEIEGLKFMPVKSNKLPIIKGWQHLDVKHNLSDCEAVGLVCGALSGGLEVIDIDCKYDLTGRLFENYKRLINEANGSLLRKLVVQKTKGNGYHIIYRCSKIEGNLKFANRQTTDEEKNNTYQKSYKEALKNSEDDNQAKEIAEKARKNDKVRVLLESRGEGGYIMCFPSEGYEIIYGDLYSITELTPEERDTLHSVARQFNSVFDEVVIPKKASLVKTKGLSPFEDYNQRADVVALLQKHGWKVVGNKGNKTIFLRAGQTTSQSSGNYDHDKNWFSVFTTSTEFEPQKAYLPYAVFAYLECNKDFTLASQKLYEMGYGDRTEEKKKTETTSTRVIKSRVVVDDNDYSFIAKPTDYNPYLQQVIDGTLPMGLTTGSPSLDEHLMLKKGQLVMGVGHDNTGKSVWFWWLFLVAAMYHGWKGLIFSSENTIGGFMRKMIQFYWGKQLMSTDRFSMTESEYKIAKAFIEKHFVIIKAQEELYNYKDILNMVKKARVIHPDLSYCFIDPYNSLKTDLSGFSKLSTHDYHYEALSEIKAYGQQTGFGFYVNNHAVTESLRKLDKDGYPLAPNKADTEGGGKFSNKADDFITIHRKVQHPTDWMITEIHVRKVKDTETGGKPTNINLPVKFKNYKGGTAFIEYLELGGTPIDPIASWHDKNQLVQKELPINDLDSTLNSGKDPF